MTSTAKPRIVIVRGSVGSPGAAAFINELKRSGAKVVGLDNNPLSSGLYISDKGYLVPKGNDPKLLTEIIKICNIENPDVIISTSEDEVLALSKQKELFAKKGILLLCPDYDIVRICRDKLETHKILRKYDIPTPELYEKDKAKFPCIIKPQFGKGAIDVFKVENKNEFEFYLRKVKHPVIQEFVKGDEYSIDVLSDLNGKPISIVPRLRIQVESGISMKGMIVADKKIIKYCDYIARKLKLVGLSCIQCIKNDQGIKFIEINTRFGGGSILSIKADPTIIPNLMRIIKGKKPLKSGKLKNGLTMLRYYNEIFITKDKLLQK